MTTPINYQEFLPHRLGQTTIREANQSDLGNLLELLANMHPEDEIPAPDPATQAVYAAILADPQRVVLIADTDSAPVVGSLDLFVMNNLTRGHRPWAGIENLIVNPQMRRQGIGKALMETAINLAVSCGCYKIQLVSHDRRDAAHHLYDDCGLNAPVQGYRRYL